MEELVGSEKYMNPLSDFGFGKIFFHESNKDLLINFLNELLGGQERITDISYQPAVQFGETEADRKAIYDVFCINDKGEHLIIEMQKAKQTHFRDRCVFYATYPLQKQAPKGKWDFELKAVYMIAIADFVIFDEFEDDREHCIEYVDLLRRRTKTLYSNKLNFVFVELPKFTKGINELETNIDKWLFSLRHLSQLDARPPEIQGKIFEKLYNTAQTKQLTSLEMETYRKSILEYYDIQDCMSCARHEGELRGEEKGKLEGEKRATIEVAKNLKKIGMDARQIKACTNLSEDEINRL
ncbi:hypothetical protein FACS1894195_4000 [Bacteroidia bacterium]|nr:hypothetical protein FACS1894195_4000 [Bacteroidia bacterium]